MLRACLLWILVLLGALCSLAPLCARLHAEHTVRGIDLVVDYTAVLDLCQSEGLDPREILGKLKEAGATSVAYSETTLDRLVGTGQIAAYTGSDLMRDDILTRSASNSDSSKTKARPDPARAYLLVYDPQTLADLVKYLRIFLGPDRCHLWASGKPSFQDPSILEVATNLRTLASMGLGFPNTELAAARSAGMTIWLRPQNRGRFQESHVKDYLEAIAALKPIGVRGVIFEGGNNDVLGYPDSLDTTVAFLQSTNLLFGNIEVPVVEAAQKGSQTLGRKLDNLTVRVMSMSPQQQKLTPGDAVDRLRLGARERNMRVLYLRFFTTADTGKSLLLTNLDFVADLREALARSGFTFDGARPFPRMEPRPSWLAGMTLGAVAAGILFLDLFFTVPLNVCRVLLIGMPLIVTGMSFAHRGGLASMGMALESAMAFAVLGLASGLPMLIREAGSADSSRAALSGAILPLILVTCVSLVGGLYMAGFMSSTTFMLSVSQFRGIKLIMVVAPAIVGLLFVTRYAPRPEPLMQVLNRRVVLWHIAAFATLAVAAAFYIERTGNASPAAASDLERAVRNFLENILVLRPRFKEFALGHPAWFVLAVLLWKQRGAAWLWLFALAIAIGQVDVVDTFAHAHTPYFMSLLRALIGLVIGVVAGLGAGALVAKFVRRGIPMELEGSTRAGSPPK